MVKWLLGILPWMDENKAQIAIDAAGPLLQGLLRFTVPLSLISFLIGLCIALIVALIYVYPERKWWLRLLYGITRFYLLLIRGTPLLVQLFIIFYGLPNIGIILDPLISAVIAFSLNTGAYASETLRAAILSVPKGQWEAGYSLGLNYRQNIRLVVLPQAIRIAIPPLSNSFIGLIKESSLASVVLVPEMMRQANIIASTTYEFMLVYSEAALYYWVLCFLLYTIQQRLEVYFQYD